MAQHVCARSPPSSPTMSSTRWAMPKPAGQMHHQRQAGAALRLRRAAQRLLLLGREIGRDADLPDQADPDAAVADPVMRLATISSAMSSTVIAQRGGMRGLQIIAGAHDDVEAGRLRDAPQGRGIAADAAAGRVDDGPAAGLGEGLQFGDRQRLVVERAVVVVDEGIQPQFAEDARMDGKVGEMLPLGRPSAGATSSGSR